MFGILNTAAFQGAGPKEHAQSRVLGKIQDLFEELSHKEDAVNENGEKIQVPVLNDGVTSITLDDAWWEMLKGRIFGAGIEWLASASRRVTAAYDAVEAAESVSPVATVKDDVVPSKRRGKK